MLEQEGTSCSAVRELAYELALGSLNGAERSAVLAHLQGCEDCARLAGELAAASDRLLEMAPELEPPVGFEVRLLERLERTERSRHTSRRARLLVAASVLAAAGGGIAAGMLATGSPAAPGGVRLAALVGRGGERGAVALEQGHPGWVAMRVAGLKESYWVSCVVSTGSRQAKVGTFELSRGAGHWRAALPAGVPVGSVKSAEIVGPNGVVLARASFPG